LRNFLAAYDHLLPAEKRDATAEAWFKAAQTFANRLDPLTAPGDVAQDLDPSDEVLERLTVGEKRAAQDAAQQRAHEDRAYGQPSNSPGRYPFWLRHGR
jgi:hypothetical protein